MLIKMTEGKLFSVFVILSMLALVACGGAEGPSPVVPSVLSTSTEIQTLEQTPTSLSTITPAVVSGTVTIWHSWEDPYVPALLRRIHEFNSLYPNVYFDVLYVPALDLRSAFEQAAQDARGPTLLIGQAEWGPGFYDAGLAADLTNSIPADSLNALNPAAVGTGRYKGALVSVPVDIRGVVLYRNASIIPIAPSTFEELISLAKDAAHGQTFGAVLDRSFFYSGAHLMGLGGRLMTPEGLPAFNDEKGLAWVNLLQAYSEAGPTEFFTDNDLNLFKEGHVGFIIDGTWNRSVLAEAIGAQNLAIDPWPIYASGALSGFVQAESIYLNPQASEEEKSASLKFLQFFLSPQSQAAVAEVGLIPALSGSPVNLAASQVQITDRLTAQSMLALVDGATYPVIPEINTYSSQLDIALKSIFESGMPPQEALQRAEEAILAGSATPTP